MNGISKIELEFLDHSNRIESEYSIEALKDAVEAWEYFSNKGNPMFSFGTIIQTHQLLMKRLRPDIAGELRGCDVWAGGNKKHFTSLYLLEENINSLCRDILRNIHIRDTRTIFITMKYHVAFENIHPFEDGNGRVGRIIYNAHRLRLGLPIHVIHEGNEQMEYYKWFK